MMKIIIIKIYTSNTWQQLDWQEMQETEEKIKNKYMKF